MKNYWYLMILFFMILWGVFPGRGDDRRSDKGIPVTELPQSAQQLLRTGFPGAQVLKCEHSPVWNEYEVKIEGGYEVEFDKEGEWFEIDSDHEPLSAHVINLLPAQAIRYLLVNYADGHVESLKRSKDGYKVSLERPDVNLYFSNTGEFLKEKD